MTVKKGCVGNGGSKPKGFIGLLTSKSAYIREVLKRKHKIANLAKRREMIKMMMKREAFVWARKMKALDKEIMREKEELEKMLAEAMGEKMDLPKVKIRVEIVPTKKMRKKGGMNMIIPEEDVCPDVLDSLGVPGQLARAVERVQESVDEARVYQEKMLNQVNSLLKIAGEI